MNVSHSPDVVVRQTRPEDFPAIEQLCLQTYPDMPPWSAPQLSEHLRRFPEGQSVAVDAGTGRLLGMTASLIVRAADYRMSTSYGTHTAHGTFANHDAEGGDVLYGAEVMVAPKAQGRGVGSKLYAARRELVRRLGLRGIRAGARMRGYHRYADRLSPEDYAAAVAAGLIEDPTLTFQLRRGFRVIGVARHYLRNDPPSHGHAAVIEWRPQRAARPTRVLRPSSDAPLRAAAG